MENIKYWEKGLQADDMPTDDLRLIAERCGVDVAIKLMEHLPGIQLYISSHAKKQLLDGYIKRNFDGTRQKANQLALECHVSVAHIYNVLKIPSSEEPKKQQLSIFG